MARILKYNEAKIKIAEIIGSRNFRKGDKLPPEREFAELLGVSIISVRRAIEEFQSVGMVRKVAGVGTFLAGELSAPDYQSKVGVISVCDPCFPSGQEMAQLRRCLESHHADYAVFAVERELMPSLADRLAECDYFMISGFITPAWLDYLGNQGKRMVQIGVAAHTYPVCRVIFDWKTAFEEALRKFRTHGFQNFGMLLVNSRAANCTPERQMLFRGLAAGNGLACREEWICEVDPARPFAAIRDYMTQYAAGLDVIFMDYHVFTFFAVSRLLHSFELPPKIVVMQTDRFLPNELDAEERFCEIYFPESIMEAAVKVLYDYPHSFAGNHETYGISPCFSGKIFNLAD